MGDRSDNLYITNLPEGLDEAMVRQFFSIYGTVTSAKVLQSPIANGKSAALLRFSSVEEASSIMKTLNGTVPTGLKEPVQIKFAAARGSSSSSTAGKGAQGYGKWNGGVATHASSPYGGVAAAGGHHSEPEISDNIYVQGLPPGTTEESLRQTFMEFGIIRSLKLLPARSPDASCAALIRYDSTETAKLTKEILNGQTPEGFQSPLVVRYAASPGATSVSAMQPTSKGGWQVALAGLSQDNTESCAVLVDMVYQSDMIPGGRQYHNDRASLYITGLPSDARETHLYKMFSPYGAIHSCSTRLGGDAIYSWCIGFVNYLDPLSAEAAITAYNGMSLPDGNQLHVSITRSKGGK